MKLKIGPYDLNQPVVPTIYPLLLLNLVKKYGVTSEDALLNCGYSEIELNQPEMRITTEQWVTQTLRALDLCGDVGLGIEFGLQMRMSSHGLLGFAILSAPTARQALQLCENYFRTRVLHYQLNLREIDEFLILEFHPLLPIPTILNRFYVECFFLNIITLLPQFTTNLLDEITFHFQWPKPQYFDKFCSELPHTEFEKPTNQVIFHTKNLDNPLDFSNVTSYYQATAIVEREFISLLGDQKDLITQVRAELVLKEDGYPNIIEIAQLLHMSERTLRRKLVNAGTSFQYLLDDVRYRDSRNMLSSTPINIQSIASKLGFQDPANFTRAFKKWSGMTPSQYRNKGC